MVNPKWENWEQKYSIQCANTMAANSAGSHEMTQLRILKHGEIFKVLLAFSPQDIFLQ